GGLFQNGGSYYDLFEEAFGADPTDTLRTYLVSGSSFPSSSYSNAYGISLRVVLLPSTDKRISPVLNSITLNYSSDTQSGSFVLDTYEDWQNARSSSNIKQVGDSVSILNTARTNNLIYG